MAANGQRAARRGGSPYPKADLSPRLVGKAIDLLLAYLLAWIVPHVGPLAGMAYLLVADAIHNGQSIGKRLMGIKTVHIPTRSPATPIHSAVRNLPTSLAFALTLNPVLALVAGPILAFEANMAFSDPLGIRIGDIFADTQVVDAKVPLETPVAMDPMVRARHGIAGGEMGEAAEARTQG